MTLPRTLPWIGGTLLLLTWLLVESQGPRSESYVYAQRDVARVSLGEAGLRAAVLEARAGLLRNDDVLDDDMRVLSDAVAELHRQARVRPRDAPLLDALVLTAARDGAALERFKTDNALLQNSLAYFRNLDSVYAGAAGDTPVTGAVALLGNAVLLLKGDPTALAPARMQARLAGLERVLSALPPGAEQDRLRLLLAHGRVLSRLMPAVDADLADLFHISTYDLRQAVRAGQDARRHAEEARAARYRLALYFTAVLLAALLARVVLFWRAGQIQLKERAELEHLIAALSTRLIAAFPEQFDEAAGEILARLGEGFAADRAWMVVAGARPTVHRWSTDARHLPPWPPQWPSPDLIARARAAGRLPGEVLRLSDLDAGGPVPPALRTAGLSDWCGIMLRAGASPSDRAGRPCLLGFDLVRDARMSWPRGGAGMVRMAGEVVQGALDRRAALLQRRELEQRLGRARRLEAVGAFASGIAHNVNNVIGAVAGHVELAAERAAGHPADETVSHHLREIADATDRAQELVAAILAFGTRGEADRRTFPLEELVGGAVSMLRVTAPPDVEMVVDLQAGDVPVRGNFADLQQVLVNLVRNAFQAMPEGGRVLIDAAAERVPTERRLSHDLLAPGDYLRMAVADTGTGMSPRVLARLFEPFFTSRPGGTGLGLSTAREVVHDHGGALDVTSAPGAGSVFTVWLPVAGDGRDHPEITVRGNGESVLLVTPDRALLAQDEDMLAALRYEPVGFAALDHALREARADPGRFAALLLDAGRHGDGLDHARLVRAAGIDTPIILLAGAATPPGSHAISDTASLGVVAVLARPVGAATLAEALSHCLARMRQPQE